MPKNISVALCIFGILAIVTVAGIGLHSELARWWISRYPDVTYICAEAPYAVGLVTLLLLWFGFALISGKWNPLESVRGADQRWSTSKFQMFLWTVAALFAYASLFAAFVGAHLLTSVSAISLPSNLLLAMGLSAATAVAAKGIVMNQLNNSTVSRTSIVPTEAALGDLLKDDNGALDLTKVQLLAWTFVAIGAFLTKVFHNIHNLGPKTDLPDIDNALMVLMGIGQGAYLAKKVTVTTAPAIATVVPASIQSKPTTSGIPGTAGTPSPGTEVTLNGSNFGSTQGAGDVVTMHGVAGNLNLKVNIWSDAKITCFLPDGTPAERYTLVVSIKNPDMDSNSAVLVVT